MKLNHLILTWLLLLGVTEVIVGICNAHYLDAEYLSVFVFFIAIIVLIVALIINYSLKKKNKKSF